MPLMGYFPFIDIRRAISEEDITLDLRMSVNVPIPRKSPRKILQNLAIPTKVEKTPTHYAHVEPSFQRRFI